MLGFTLGFHKLYFFFVLEKKIEAVGFHKFRNIDYKKIEGTTFFLQKVFFLS
jgi:hypothetical protein